MKKEYIPEVTNDKVKKILGSLIFSKIQVS